MVSKSDGRYRRSIVSGNLEVPTSVALDPQYGRMFYADAGATAKIVVAWMDGSKPRDLVVENVRHPTGKFSTPVHQLSTFFQLWLYYVIQPLPAFVVFVSRINY